MAKPIKPAAGPSRRDKLASFETARKAEQRRRTIGLLAICTVLAVALLAYPVYLFAEDYRARTATIGQLGASIADAGCDPVAAKPATGNLNHVADGTKVTYDRSPADSGAHYNSPAPFTKRFYTPDDRPPVETLVHNLEHGYTVAWYRTDAPQGQVDDLAAIAKTFGGEDYDPTDKFIAAPWSEADGAGLPESKNLVLARWTADPANPADAAQQRGVQQACSSISGPAIEEFKAKYPVASSPEADAA